MIIENQKDLTFSGDSITGEYGILAKAGEGTMTINSAGTFEMGEIRALGGNLLVKSNIDVNSVSILGENALLSFENVNNAKINDSLSLSRGGTLSLLQSKVTAGNLVRFDNSVIDLKDASSKITAGTIDLLNASKVQGF